MDPQRWQRIKGIFDDALEAGPEGRGAVIAQACADDAALSDDVLRLLASFDSSENFIETTAVAENLSMFDRLVPAISTGDLFGHYRIDRKIGSGGMGEVYLATDEKLGRQVAIKVLREEFARHKDNVQRFLREAKAASSLNHPNILVIHEINIGDAGNYIVSEFVEGETLRQRLAGRPLNFSEVLDVTIQVAEALNAAHGASIVHRDIKPENIALRPDGYVKVLDFGLAKLVEAGQGFFEGSDKNQTAKGIIMGTVNYMSPEQAKGNNVDRRTDIFSLGVVLYEMIAGVTPFRGDSTSESFANLINAEPRPLSRYSPNVPAELERIVTSLLAKDPEARYQTMTDLLTDLKSLRKHLEFQDENKPVDDDDARAKFSGPSEDAEAAHQNSIAVLPFTNIGGDAENEYFCDGLAEELLNALAKIKDLKVAARTSAFSFKGKNTTVSEIGDALNVRTVLEGSVRRSGNRLRITAKLVNAADGYHLWSERFDGEMKDIFELQDEITLLVIDKMKVNFLSAEKAAVLKRLTENPDAYEYYLKGIYYRWKLSPQEFGKCLKYFQLAVEADPNFGMAYFGLASYYGYGTAWGLVDMPPDEGWAKAEAAIQKSIEVDPTLPEIQLTLAAFDLVNRRKFKEAGEAIRREVKMNPDFAEIHHSHAFYLLVTGSFDDSVDESTQALQLDPLSVNYSRFLGVSFLCARRFDEAIEQFHQALELEPNNPSVHEILGEAYAHAGLFEDALTSWKNAATFEGDSEIAGIIENNADDFEIAVCAVARKRIERAEKRIAEGEFVLAIHFVRAYMLLGENDQTFDWLEKAVEQRNVFPLLMNSDPFYDRLRPDPRFQESMKRVGFDAEGGLTQNISALPRIPGEKHRENRFIAAVPGRGYKDVAAVSQNDGYNSGSEATLSQSSNTRAGRRRSRNLFTLLAAIVVLALATLGFYLLPNRGSTALAGDINSLAVLPFKPLVIENRDESMELGMTDTLISKLSGGDISVRPLAAVRRFGAIDQDPVSAGRALGVEAVMDGNIQIANDRVRVSAKLIRVSDGKQLWADQFNEKASDIFELQNSISERVASQLRSTLGNKLRKNYTESLEAYELYSKCKLHISRLILPELQKGIALCEQAIAVDPGYAPVYVELANAYHSMVLTNDVRPSDVMPKAKAAARKAIEIDDGLAEAHTTLAFISFWYDFDPSEAEREHRRSLELDPRSSWSRFAYAHFLSNTGRHEEAIAEIKRARELDPVSLVINTQEGQILFFAGRDDEALRVLQATAEMDSNFWLTPLFITRIYIKRGEWDAALAAATSARDLSHGSAEAIAYIGFAQAKMGKVSEARATLDELEERAKQRYVPAYTLAQLYLALGEKEKALDLLETSFANRDALMTFIKVEPKWDPLRSEPRFLELMKKMNLN